MYDTPVLLGGSEVESIVLGTAENAAQRLGCFMSAPAKDLLLRHALPELDRENNEGRLESRRAEVERNTEQLIQYIVTEEISAAQTREITYQHMIQGLSAFCRKFPNLYPICTRNK